MPCKLREILKKRKTKKKISNAKIGITIDIFHINKHIIVCILDKNHIQVSLVNVIERKALMLFTQISKG